ncbi:lipopolysaccharide biosynthesis protein [Latilactobacillus curvatus]
MKENLFDRGFIRNILYAFGSQIISLLLSVILTLLIPKLIGVNDFGYWQLFIFYSSYITFFHFGINDGIYLENGGKKEANIDKSSINGQFLFSIIMELIVSIVIIVYAYVNPSSIDRQFVIYQTVINFILFSAADFLGYVFQAINQTKIFSISIIINRVIFIVIILSMVLIKSVDYKKMIIGYNVAQLISLIYCLEKGSFILKTKIPSLSNVVKDSMHSISVGIKLMLANIASMLILGFARFLVDNEWGINEFAKLSFALTLTNFFLLFINQFSMVMFPALKGINESSQKKYYVFFSKVLNIILPVLLILYFPIQIVLKKWLPQYEISIYYFGLLLPLCISNGRMQLLNNTYLKVLRKEKLLLYLNIIIVVINVVTTMISVYVFKSMVAIIISLVFVTWLRNMISELYLSKILDARIKGQLMDFILMTFFIICLINIDNICFTILFIAYYIVFLIYNRSGFVEMASLIKEKLK